LGINHQQKPSHSPPRTYPPEQWLLQSTSRVGNPSKNHQRQTSPCTIPTIPPDKGGGGQVENINLQNKEWPETNTKISLLESLLNNIMLFKLFQRKCVFQTINNMVQ